MPGRRDDMGRDIRGRRPAGPARSQWLAERIRPQRTIQPGHKVRNAGLTPKKAHYQAPVTILCILNADALLRRRRDWDSGSQPDPSYPQQSLNVLSALLLRYSDSAALLGFSVLNEPLVRSKASVLRQSLICTETYACSGWV